jgi:hypothetical protein
MSCSSKCSSVLILDELPDDRVLLSWQQCLGSGLVFLYQRLLQAMCKRVLALNLRFRSGLSSFDRRQPRQ